MTEHMDQIKNGILEIERETLLKLLRFLRSAAPQAVELADKKDQMLTDLESGTVSSTRVAWMRHRRMGDELAVGSFNRGVFELADGLNQRLRKLNDANSALLGNQSPILWDGR